MHLASGLGIGIERKMRAKLMKNVYRVLLHKRGQLALAACLLGSATYIALHDVSRQSTPNKGVPSLVSTAKGPGYTANPVVASTSASRKNARTVFPENTNRYWCVADLANIPGDALVVWRWQHVTGGTAEELYTSPPYAYGSATRIAYLDGPFAAGQYRCQVIVHEAVSGAAEFMVK
jgi:hypothetical protein